jgi:hypothetical protein
MESLHFIKSQFGLGDPEVRNIPAWSRRRRWAPSSFVRTELAVEVLSPGRGRSFVRLRRKEWGKAETQVQEKEKEKRLMGMPCLCEKCVEKKWKGVPGRVEVTPVKAGLDAFFGQE